MGSAIDEEMQWRSFFLTVDVCCVVLHIQVSSRRKPCR
jgi:hypothetical protein